MPEFRLFRITPGRITPGRIICAFLGAFFASLSLIPGFAMTLFLVLACRIADGPCPVFRQTRVGMRSRGFEILKIRTMIPGPGFVSTAPGDPRVTRFGRFLRFSSLDEIPQLFNVAAGSMDFVGPRPDVPVQVAANYTLPMKAARLSLRPGITGMAQVFGRSGLNLRQRDAMDIYYVFNRGLRLDLLVVLKTIQTVAGCHGSY